MEVKTIGVIGAGAMGRGIAYAAACGGYRTILEDVSPEMLEQGIAYIRQNLEEGVARGKVTEEQRNIALANLTTSRSVEDLCREADLLIEAVPEEMEVKLEIFTIFDKFALPAAILASNTSSLSITELAAITFRAQNCIGMHFFNPVPVMKLVEVIRGLATSQSTYNMVRDLAIALDKTPVEVNDAPGFVSNRVLMPLLNEAMYAVMEGVATAPAVDEVFKLGMAHPMGPLTLADFIGLDVCLDIMRVLHAGLGDPKYRPCPLLIKMVDAGWLGKKSGQGFYQY